MVVPSHVGNGKLRTPGPVNRPVKSAYKNPFFFKKKGERLCLSVIPLT